MKALFIGGIKSGKSHSAEQYTLRLCRHSGLDPESTNRSWILNQVQDDRNDKANTIPVKPFYLATTEFIDEEMQARIDVHRQRRNEHFTTLEAPLDIYAALQGCDGPVLVECTTMWINNMLYHNHSKEQIVEHIARVLSLPGDLVFVHNDVGSGIIPDNALARRYADISGIVSQVIANRCDEVYHCIAGIAARIK